VFLISLDPTRRSEIRKTRLVRRLGTISAGVQHKVLDALQEMFAQ